MKKPTVRTLKQARAFVLKSGLCGIFSDAKRGMPNLWEATDLPGRQPGEGGWGQKVTSIWTWKNELPALYPDEIFYGKIRGGLAVLMSMDYLRDYYPKNHVPLKQCSAMAQKIAALIKLDPLTTPQLRAELGIAEKAEKSAFERALKELQITLNIARRNSLTDEYDTWVTFREQYLEIVRSAEG